MAQQVRVLALVVEEGSSFYSQNPHGALTTLKSQGIRPSLLASMVICRSHTHTLAGRTPYALTTNNKHQARCDDTHLHTSNLSTWETKASWVYSLSPSSTTATMRTVSVLGLLQIQQPQSSEW